MHVGRPFPRLFVVVEIEHGSHRVHPQSVDMEHVEPENGVRYQKALHFVAAPVENARAPALHFHFILALIFIAGRSVELVKAVFVLGKMRGHPVENDAYPVFMELVHQPHEFMRRAETGGNAEIPRDLIAPAAVERIFRHGHEFHVRIPHALYVGHEFFGKFRIGEIPAVLLLLPAAEMHFVNIDGRGIYRGAFRLLPVRAVPPLVSAEIVHFGRGMRRRFAVESVRIGFVDPPLFRFYGKLVIIVSLHPRDKSFVDTLGAYPFHGIAFGIPAVEIAHDGYSLRARRPGSEKHALSAFAAAEMRA